MSEAPREEVKRPDVAHEKSDVSVRGVLWFAAGLIVFAAAIEIAQYWIPGRHARLGDFIVDAVSACVGVAVAWLSIKTMSGRGSAFRDTACQRSR